MTRMALPKRGRAAHTAIVRVGCRVTGCGWVIEVLDEAPAIVMALHARTSHENEHILRGECPDQTRV